MKNKPTIKILVACNIAAMLLLCTFYVWQYVSKRNAQIARVNKIATSVEKDGVMSADEYKKMNDVAKHIADSKSLSDDEVDWVCTQIQQSWSKDYNKGLYARVNLSWILSDSLDKTTPEQHEKLFQAFLPMATVNDSEDKIGMDRTFFCAISGKLKDKRSLNYLLPLLNDPRPRVKRSADSAIKAIQKA